METAPTITLREFFCLSNHSLHRGSMNRVRSIVVCAAVCVCATVHDIHAITDSSLAGHVRNLGITFGHSTGYALSYRHWLGRFGVQASFLPYYRREDRDVAFEMYGGLAGLYLLKSAKYVNLFACAGSHVRYSYDKYYYDPDYWDVYDEMEPGITRTAGLYGGAGPGIDLHLWRMSINCMVTIEGFTNFEGSRGVRHSEEFAMYYSW